MIDPDSSDERTLMWEVTAAQGRIDELVTVVERQAPAEARVYRTADRVVVIDPGGVGPGHVPPELLGRPPHSWRFTPVARTSAGQHSVGHERGA